jgi:hypothetical protein
VAAWPVTVIAVLLTIKNHGGVCIRRQRFTPSFTDPRWNFLNQNAKHMVLRVLKSWGTIEYFLPAIREVESDLMLDCLSYLLNRVPRKPLSERMFKAASSVKLSNLLPFASYAALQWRYHLESLERELESQQLLSLGSSPHSIEEVFTKLGLFLLNRLLPMVWVELAYTFEKQSKGHDAIHETFLRGPRKQRI